MSDTFAITVHHNRRGKSRTAIYVTPSGKMSS